MVMTVNNMQTMNAWQKRTRQLFTVVLVACMIMAWFLTVPFLMGGVMLSDLYRKLSDLR